MGGSTDVVETSSRLQLPAADPPRRNAEGPRFINRELSWLDFNERVLALAEEERRPLLERAKFLAIFSSNLDEFFQIRVAGLMEQVSAGWTPSSPDGMTPTEQIVAIRTRAQELVRRESRIFVDHLAPDLERAGISLVQWDDLSPDDRTYLEMVFLERVFPVLTPLSVDPAHPFPYISNLSLNLAVVVRDRVTQLRRFARVKVPPLLPRFVKLPDGLRFISLEQVIAANLGSLFPGMEIVAHHLFRVTRDADLDIEIDEAEDLLSAIETSVRLRQRSPEVVRLEVTPSMPEDVLGLLTHELELEATDVYVVDGLLDLSGLWSLTALDRPDLKAPPWTGVTPRRFAPARDGEKPDLFAALRAGDVLVHLPYDSFSTTVEAFIEQASRDPSVLALKQTLYRTSDRESPIVRSLIRAAEGGKQVVALVELQARGDEEANIGWARLMEQAGVHVLYGVVGLKTHAKISLVVRDEPEGVRRYCHVGTGNYNPTTAKLYEDVGLLTADPDLTADVADLFNYLTGYSRQSGYRNLLVAPLSFRSLMIDLINAEAAVDGGRIILKMNSLVDAEMIDALYEASIAGAQIDLIVRGICCLRAGVPGMSATIRVRSLVGRYLEHSRIFRFGPKGKSARYLIGSADLMPRNLDRRVEATAEVKDPKLRQRLQEILDVCLSDDVLAWTMRPDGTYAKVPTVKGLDAQESLQRLALARAAGKPTGSRRRE
jgi:polyphosphate kinase